MEGGQASAAQRFMDDLRQLRQLAGRPSYSTLERLSDHRLRRATMSDVLNGNRVNLPDWRFVADFVSACRAAGTENGLDPNGLGTLADWKRHWDSAADGVIGALFPGHGSQTFGRQAFGRQERVTTRRTEPAPVATAGQPAPDAANAVTPPAAWGPVPPRLPDFIGRAAWLDRLHQSLTRDDRIGVVAIQGLPGVGKTQLAVEYANRHADSYDLVWWIPCDTAESAHSAMADLAVAAGVPDAARGLDGGDYAGLFELLRRRQRYARWLLIFDNAGEPEAIRDLIPPLPGYALITTRSSRWERSGEMLELDVFDRGESIEFLRHRMRKFTSGTADRLAEGVGDLPLLLEHAVESRVAVGAYLARLDAAPLELLDEQPSDYHATIASVWRTAVGRLRDDAPDAFDLLSCLSFFGPDPVPRESLERGSGPTGISIHAMLKEPIRLAVAIRTLRNAGLLRMRPGARSLAVHRVTQSVVRDMVARSGPAESGRIRHDVHLLVAAADPLTPEDPATWRSYEELRGHADASGIVACPDEAVRRFVVNLVRYLTAAADLPTAAAIADAALDRWAADPPDDGSPVVDGGATTRIAKAGALMRMAKADALFAQGMWPEAAAERQAVLATMRLDQGRWTAEILAVEATAGAQYRVTGFFAKALAADRNAVDAFAAEFGDGAPQGFSAVNGLVKDLALSGAVADATLTALGLYRDCIAFYGDEGHPAVLAARGALGRCRWLAGRHGEAATIMAEVHDGYDALTDGELEENHPWRLVHEVDYAIARRDNGLLLADLRVLADDMDKIRRRCWRAFGADHPQTLAATVVLGSILRRTAGRAGEAVRLLGEAERRYQRALPGHPYGQACGAYLAAVRYQAADGSLEHAAARAVPVIEGAVDRLADSVGGGHPLSLTALSALANALAHAGEVGAASKHGQEALAGFREIFGSDHPYVAALTANAETIQARLALAPEPLARTALAEIDFTPLPL